MTTTNGPERRARTDGAPVELFDANDATLSSRLATPCSK
jgi:hypothetical protein